jgi:F-type H+-transporting ATPase subunit epsilon
MSKIRCEVVTAERTVVEDMVDMVVAPGIEGQLGILPNHAPLMTSLTYGELVLHREGQEEELIAIGGGFMEVGPDHVIILADSAERAEEIDESRAEAARERAEELMAREHGESADLIRAQAALRRSLIRLKVARKRSRRTRDHVPRPGAPPGTGQ